MKKNSLLLSKLASYSAEVMLIMRYILPHRSIEMYLSESSVHWNFIKETAPGDAHGNLVEISIAIVEILLATALAIIINKLLFALFSCLKK